MHGLRRGAQLHEEAHMKRSVTGVSGSQSVGMWPCGVSACETPDQALHMVCLYRCAAGGRQAWTGAGWRRGCCPS
jgi:hypothetical protein